MQSVTCARPRTMSSASAWQDGAPQEPQSSPGRLPTMRSSSCILPSATATLLSRFITGAYSSGTSQNALSGISSGRGSGPSPLERWRARNFAT